MPPSLGNQFPDEFKKEYAKRCLQQRAVLRCHVEFTNQPKIKRVIVLGREQDDIGTVVINSEINANIHHNQFLQNCHIKIDAQSYSFISNESFIDCTEIQEMSYSDLKERINDKTQIFMGNVPNDLMQQIKHQLENKGLITPNMLKKYDII